ncbi:Aflatoxin B1 aldehyde reductase member 2 [Seminavis robusta]|uniref:Aflatoxin B1 aldehyde reductase member 2 n=1 Tax=Seminavis robusta TaxID=568900 RepID=A0A9N8HAU8_9STRA|nr:Aflatoxin B1 aldehyde reductase member 2 [Seminavis robusta]|eukprot:Sro310_g114070.1 Aflatoxin B1 aldehyde reductase member 2 (348) ;mRNA; f:38058-39101
MTTTTTPRIILGTMTFGGSTSLEDASLMVSDFCQPAWKELVKEDPMLDSAIMYQGGKTEVVLGEIIRQQGTSLPTSLSVATKANPFSQDKDLSPEGVRKQLEASLQSLETDSVDIFYLHAPDANHPIEATLEEVQKLFQQGKFRKFGLSNFSAWETVYIHNYMSSRKNYVVPTIYQGMYNAITRQVETELLPALRKLGMSFYCYNPLAGGMLTGKYQPADSDKEAAKRNSGVGDRFAGNSFWAKRYRERYQQQEQFAALEIVRECLTDDDLTMAEASLRWLRHHSKLTKDDGIIIGASKTGHYHANMKALANGPLTEDLVTAFGKASKVCQDVCPNYARGYSGSALN